MYTIAGWTVNTPDQVQSLLIKAVLQDDKRIVEQCLAVLSKMQG